MDRRRPGRDHDPPPGYAADRTGARQFAAAFVSGLRDPRLTILTLVAAGHSAAAHWRLEWTQHGPLLGDPAFAGLPLQMRGADTITAAHGRIAEIHHVARLRPTVSGG